MKANELMINNWVKRDTQPDGFQIDATSIVLCERRPEDYHPIPLTEEWLTELGFRNYDVNKWDTDAMTLLKYDEGCKYLANHLHVNIFYVHQLQNLYFALTGNELTLKP